MLDKFYVLKIIRDDGEVFIFDHNEILLSSDNSFINRPDITSTDVEYTDVDGGEMLAQRLQAHEQPLSGIIIPKNSTYWTLYHKLSSFFMINHYYKIIYLRKNGTMFAQKDAWIVSNLQIPINPKEDYSNFSLTFKFKASSLYGYAEDSSGDEIPENTVWLPLLNSASGGQVWNEIGQVWNSIGQVWQAGDGGVQTVSIDSVSKIYPVWTVEGECVDPKLQNNTTDTTASYTGTVAEGQTLIVDFETGEAKLDGAIVSRNIIGQVSCNSGDNIMGFNSEGGHIKKSSISWNNIIG